MLDEKTIEELHSYYDRLPGGICLVKADDSEEILLANAELLNYYQCANWQEFKELTGGTYRGMVEASDYIPLKDIVRVKGQPEAMPTSSSRTGREKAISIKEMRS